MLWQTRYDFQCGLVVSRDRESVASGAKKALIPILIICSIGSKIPSVSAATLSLEPTLFNFPRTPRQQFHSLSAASAKSGKTSSIFCFGEEVDDYQDGEIASHSDESLTEGADLKAGNIALERIMLGSRCRQEIPQSGSGTC
jgi:hypothetical protein